MVKKTVVRYTLDECVKCLKCVRACPTSALSLVDNKIVIDDERCINCLHCVHTCHNKGLRVSGSPLSEIENYDYTVCLVPSALTLRFPSREKVEEVFFRIKSLGFDEVVDISGVEGAMMEETFRISDEMVTTSIITSFCPVINRLIERDYPMLMQHLAPLKYPSETAARMVRARLAGKGNVGIFNLCECGALLSIAKYPFDNMQYEVDHAVSMADIIPVIQKDEPEGRMDVDLCRAGLQSCNPALIPQRPEYLLADGFDKITDVLDMAEFDLLTSFNLLYLFMCFNGCTGGNLMFGNAYLTRNNIDALAGAGTGYPEVPDIPFDHMYTEHMLLPENEQHNIVEKLSFFRKVNEELEHLPGLDCSACGFKTCRIMAEEIVKGNRGRGDCRILAAGKSGGKKEDGSQGTS